MFKLHTILYVDNQESSKHFYSEVLLLEPGLHVPGMTEFQLSEYCVLGLMPLASIKRLLGDVLPDPAQSQGIPRAELYLLVDDSSEFYKRALANGAKELSPPAWRSWGDKVAYCLDLDGHVLAFAERRENNSK